MTTKRSHEFLTATALITLPLLSAAQESTGVLDEIIVTATRRDESVQDVPYNIQAISAQTLQLTGAIDQSDFARMIPGLSMVDRGARDGVEFVLRGLTTGSNSGSIGQTTTTYVDDTQVDLYYGLLDLKLLDVERIEVLRGPQGTLYGGGAIGGTIRYISTPPDLAQTSGRVSGTGLVHERRRRQSGRERHAQPAADRGQVGRARQRRLLRQRRLHRQRAAGRVGHQLGSHRIRPNCSARAAHRRARYRAHALLPARRVRRGFHGLRDARRPARRHIRAGRRRLSPCRARRIFR